MSSAIPVQYDADSQETPSFDGYRHAICDPTIDDRFLLCIGCARRLAETAHRKRIRR